MSRCIEVRERLTRTSMLWRSASPLEHRIEDHERAAGVSLCERGAVDSFKVVKVNILSNVTKRGVKYLLQLRYAVLNIGGLRGMVQKAHKFVRMTEKPESPGRAYIC